MLEHDAHAVSLAEQPLPSRVSTCLAEPVINPGVRRDGYSISRSPRAYSVVDIVVVVEHPIIEAPDPIDRRAQERHAAAHRVEPLGRNLRVLIGLPEREISRPS